METDYWRTVFLWRTKVHGGITRETLRWAEVHPQRNVKREERSSFRHAKVWAGVPHLKEWRAKSSAAFVQWYFSWARDLAEYRPTAFVPEIPEEGKHRGVCIEEDESLSLYREDFQIRNTLPTNSFVMI